MDIIYSAPTWAIFAFGVTASLIIAAYLAIRFHEDDWVMNAVLSVGSFLFAALLVVGIPMAMRGEADYGKWCAAQGGHVDSNTQSTVVSTGTGVGVGTTTTTYCLSSDGRIIDVQ